MNVEIVIASLADLNSEIGGPGGIRTPDLLNAIQTRSQLRHGPTPAGCKGYPAGLTRRLQWPGTKPRTAPASRPRTKSAPARRVWTNVTAAYQRGHTGKFSGRLVGRGFRR
jgi:hypothetical protein